MGSDEKNYITPSGFKTLTDELDHLMKEERPKVTELVAWAASLGDRSENADYQYGKKRLREIDRRLRFLTKRIEAAEIIDPAKVKYDKVQFGATVTFCNEEDEERTVTIVGVDETNSELNRISWKSPMAKALLGKEEGDTCVIRTPQGDVEVEIVNIAYQGVS